MAIALGLSVALCVCLVFLLAAGGAAFYLGSTRMVYFTPPAQVYPSPTRPTYDEVTPVPAAPEDVSPMAVELLSAELPPRDRYDLARRFLGLDDVPPPAPVNYVVGDVETFWVDNDDTETTIEVQAQLVYISDHAYMWVEQGVSFDYNALADAARRFSRQIYPTDREYFGSEPLPGIDGDPRLHILHSTELGSMVLGYFFSPNQYPASAVPYSNQREMFFINIQNIAPGSGEYDSVLAHEFQHMIHWNVDQNEDYWLNEGMSELAAFLNGYGASGFVPFFLMDPDLQLNGWLEDDDLNANYGSSFLFVAYFLDRFGREALRSLVASPSNGLASVDATLTQIGAGVTADDVFADWVIANLINDTSIPPGVYGYTSLPALYPASRVEGFGVYPVDSGWREVHQYGTDYIELYTPGEVTISFEGAQQVHIFPADAANTDGDPATDDRFVWWSNRGDDSDTTLTRAVDLRGVTQAMLEYDLWYWIEDRWDYAYLTVSADGGQTWAILPTPNTTTDNPHGNSYGPGYTGMSARQPGANASGWLHETVDLSTYAGQEILLRFEMLTDDGVNQPGLVVDNICIRAIGWCDDVEAGDGGWEAHGFIRINNVLAQRFVVQIVIPADDGSTRVVRMPLNDANRGEVTVTIGSRPATLVVSGLTRYTSEPASYRYTITPVGQ